MSKDKARLATAIFCVPFFGLIANLYRIAPELRLVILWCFAVPGAFKFIRVVFIWLTTEGEPVKIRLPRWLQRKKKPMSYKDYAEAGNNGRNG